MTLDDVFAVDEGHFHVELGELRLAVGARVFVAEAADDLHVFVAAADHQKLLEKLRRLGQGVKAAGDEARGDDEIARAFGGGLVRKGVSISQKPRSPR